MCSKQICELCRQRCSELDAVTLSMDTWQRLWLTRPLTRFAFLYQIVYSIRDGSLTGILKLVIKAPETIHFSF